jgi:hypothetical protein
MEQDVIMSQFMCGKIDEVPFHKLLRISGLTIVLPLTKDGLLTSCTTRVGS